MGTYIGLLKYTGQGIANIKDSASRLDGARSAFASMGVELKDFYLTFGQYDALVVMEAPDDATAAAAVLATGAQGNVSTETLKAFTESEFRGVIASLP
ncbi:MAG: GYD domain-containing protein [Acidimicrobiia bacterium]|nr:GYD domain-containing protein [Acidimicrobiia bacterium]